MNQAIDTSSTGRYWPQFDPNAPPTRLEALLHGDSEIAAEQFVDWLASEGQADTLYCIILDRLQEDDVKAAAEQWAKEVGRG